ncbi:predicted protein [Aspergillus terreus NIH2624]|uniref:Kinetochore protein mis14 n=1 Tax=Aspergillus terreus (strain NIH 2624 / FGSC A1156) TaxID=341663 RepID=Q0CP70_ASPTN|nr:uncharacterized protein ATEG_04514 [Aspergillus terreus NIH2624]EAU34961.1 predicted protein [Aspergillus terreus NIH2624]
MRERVRELVDEFINRTFTTASSSISINGLDSSSPQFPFPAAFTAPVETVEYEQYDSRLAARVTSLYAQLESLTTTVAQLRRDAPRRAAAAYAEQLKKTLEDDDADEDDEEEGGLEDALDGLHGHDADGQGQDVEMPDADENGSQARDRRTRSRRDLSRSDRKLQLPLGTDHEAERWRSGEMAEVYEDALRTLLRLQGGVAAGDAAGSTDEAADGNGLATTVGKAERAAQAVDVVEKK